MKGQYMPAFVFATPLLLGTIFSGLDLPKLKRPTGDIGISNSAATPFTRDTVFPAPGRLTFSPTNKEHSKSWSWLILQRRKEIQWPRTQGHQPKHWLEPTAKPTAEPTPGHSRAKRSFYPLCHHSRWFSDITFMWWRNQGTVLSHLQCQMPPSSHSLMRPLLQTTEQWVKCFKVDLAELLASRWAATWRNH